ncbi:long-chain fatty acid--CoA ligase [Mesorhizobium sp. J428]|uniref:long-chain fatty acid--CoA ligase n=1 Tax=Mesorhizobium sp. J428 TaxID=2898440 RepID=UPI002150C8F5|nr:long-chain fatty acid--CoA ligase [Mesorhizobium sp. J428]MCR5858568.1 long-chain fatty acid--CoA ligase [Mesorhizobium sp. J428]
MIQAIAGDAWPWARSYPGGFSPDVALDTWPVHEAVDRSAEQFGDTIAFIFRNAKISYRDLKREADRAAAGFAAIGIGKGDRVALLLPNTLYHPYAFFGALKAGATVVHLSPLDAPKVIAHKLSDSGARTLVTTNIGSIAAGVVPLLGSGLVDRIIVGDDVRFGPSPLTGPLPAADGMTAWDDFVEATVPTAFPPVAVEDLALLQYTGGTTGLPKAAMLTHANMSAAASSYALWSAADGLTRLGQEKVLLVLPLFHIYALVAVMLRALIDGQTMVLHTRFDAETALAEIEAGVTVFPGVPTMWIAICSLHGFEKRDISSLHYCGSGGAPLPVEVARRLKDLAGIELLGGWGMTETSPAGTNIPRGRPDKAGTIGLPLPGIRMRIVSLDDPRRELASGETGEIAVKGANVTSGYLNRPEENAAAFAEGWFLTGDIGHMDEDGFFFLVDRKKDMIISGGFNVYPQMIEQVIYEHPDVEEVLVIGIPDDYRGEAAKAFVKLRAGAAELTLEGLRAFLKSRLGPHEVPAALDIRAALPRTPVGKLSKLELKREERDKAASQSQGA